MDNFSDYMKIEKFFLSQFKNWNPDTFYAGTSNAVAFIWNATRDKYYASDVPGKKHHQMVDEIEEIAEDGYSNHQFVVGRSIYADGKTGQDEVDAWATAEEFEGFFPVQFVAFWEDHEFFHDLTSTSLIDKFLHKCMSRTFKEVHSEPIVFVDKKTIILDEAREPHRFFDAASQREEEKITLNGKTYTSSELRNMRGKLHYLPVTSPERGEIRRVAELLNQTPYRNKFIDLIKQATLARPTHKSDKWGQALTGAGLKYPGAKNWAMNSESVY